MTDEDQPAAIPPDGGWTPTRRTRVILIAVAAVVVALVAAVGLASSSDEEAEVVVACAPSAGSARPGPASLQPEPGPDSLPPAQLCAFGDDASVDIASFLGEAPLVVNFWATWCAPCVNEMPEFQQLHEQADGRLRLIGINTQDAPPLAREFIDELGISYDLLRDPQGDYFTANAGFGMPTTLFVTPQGQIAFRQTGPLTLAQMADLAQEHLDVTVEVPR